MPNVTFAFAGTPRPRGGPGRLGRAYLKAAAEIERHLEAAQDADRRAGLGVKAQEAPEFELWTESQPNDEIGLVAHSRRVFFLKSLKVGFVALS